ncbi:MAG: hypothetical protein MJ252_01105 [archaeon]|nr:hypothetical protein [archaeon]
MADTNYRRNKESNQRNRQIYSRPIGKNQKKTSDLNESSPRGKSNRFDKSTSGNENDSSAYGEILFLDPNDANTSMRRNQESSPITEGRPSNDLNTSRGRYGRGALNTSKNDETPRSPRVITMNRGRERVSRSPKTINIGESQKDVENNRRSINKGSGDLDNQGFLDQPSGSFGGGDSYLQQSPTGRSFLNQNSREIQYSMNPRDVSDAPMQRLSPKQNDDDDSNNSNDGKGGQDTSAQIRDLKRQMKKNKETEEEEVGSSSLTKKKKATTKFNSKKPKAEEERTTLTQGEIKKIVKEVSRGYANKEDQGGRLISTKTTVMPVSNDSSSMFNDRYKVLQKMNKLSAILLSKKEPTSTTHSRTETNLSRKTFDKNTLNATLAKQKKGIKAKVNPNKFLFLSLAMVASKGPNSEDRVILRKMRFDKGGVVDLAQDEGKAKAKYKVKSAKRKVGTGGAKMNFNPKYREKAAKIVQAWWRDLRGRYQKILDKIILIQSAWRGKWLRKYIYDIIYLTFLHQRFCDTIQRTMTNHIRPEVFDKLFGRKKWLAAAMRKLMKNDPRYTALRIRPYMLKWKENAKKVSKRNLRSAKIVNRKSEKDKQKKQLAKYFNEWFLRVNLQKYIEESNKEKHDKSKLFGGLKAVFGLQKYAKRKGLKQTSPKIELYLAKKLRQNQIKKIVDKKIKKNEIILRRYFYKWIKNNMKNRMNESFKSLAVKNIMRSNNNFNKRMLSKYFHMWKSSLPKAQFDIYYKGSNLLERFCLRNTYKMPLSAMSQGQRLRSRNNGGQLAYKIKRRFNKDNLSKYFNKWLKNAYGLAGQTEKGKFFGRLVNTILKKTKNRILSNRFNQWRKKPDIDLEALFQRYKGLTNLVRRTVKFVIRPTKKEFFDKTKGTVSDSAKQRAAKKLVEKYLNTDRLSMRHTFNKWKDQCRNMVIKDLKAQLIVYLSATNDIRNRRNTLGKYFSKWRLVNNSLKNHGDYQKLKEFQKFLDLLNSKYFGSMVRFWTKLNKKMGKDYRPNILKQIADRLNQPRTNLRDAFHRWLNEVRDQQNNELNKNFREKVLRSSCKKVFDRSNRDKLIKAFFKWKNMSRNADDYYPKINKGLEKLRSALRKKECKDPLEKIKNTKNMGRHVEKLLRSKVRRRKQNDKDDLKKYFNRWRQEILYQKIKENKAILLKNLFIDRLTKGTKLQLMKYFEKWKNSKNAGFDSNFLEALKLVQNFCERPHRRPVYEAFHKVLLDKKKLDALCKLFPGLDAAKNKNLRDKFYQWYRNAMKIDPDRDEKRKNKLRRLLKSKYGKPVERAFYKWIRQMAKHPDYKRIIIASDKLKSALQKTLKEPFNNIRDYTSPEYKLKQLRTKVIPNAEKANNRILRNNFNKWRDIVNEMKLKELKANLLSKLYSNTKSALRDRILRKYFTLWYNMEGPKKMDLILVRQGLNQIKKTLANYYFKDKLFPILKNLGKYNTFSALIKAAPKYYARVLKYYFDLWRLQNEKLNTKKAIKGLTSKLMHQGKKYRMKEKVKNVLRSKFHDWRDIARFMTEELKKKVPKFERLIIIANDKINGPELLNKMIDMANENRKMTKLRAIPKLKKKSDLNNLKIYFDLWRKKLMQQLFKDMQNRMKYNQLRNVFKFFEEGTLKYFVMWRVKAGIKRSTTPIEEGAKKLRKAIIREPFKTFLKLADMLNLKVPRGMPVERALIQKKRNLAKCIALRNIFERPYWNQIKSYANEIREKELRDRMFSQLMSPVMNNLNKYNPRRIFNKWREQTNALKNQDKLKALCTKMLYNSYYRTNEGLLKKYFNQWLKSCDKYKERANNLRSAADKLRNFANRKVADKMREALQHQNEMDKAKSILRLLMKTNDKNNKAGAFNKWRAIANQDKINALKAALLGSLGNRQDYKNETYAKNRMKECFNKWRINSFPRDILEKLKKIRDGANLLHEGMRKPWLRDIFDGIKERADERYKKKLLDALFGHLGPKNDLWKMKQAWNIWKDKLGDTDRMKNKLSQLLRDYLESDPVHEVLIHEPEQEILKAMNKRNEDKIQNSSKISDFCRSIPNINNQLDRMKRTLLTKDIFNKTIDKLLGKYKSAFKKWKRNARLIKAEENAKKIQAFLRERLNNPADKRKRILRGADLVDKYVKKIVMDKINNRAKENFIKRVLMNYLKKQGGYDKDAMKRNFDKWRDILPALREEEAATIIENNYRNLRARRKLDDLKKRENLLKDIMLRLISNDKEKLKSRLHQWNDKAHNLKCIEKAKILQEFFRERLEADLANKAKNKIYEMNRRHMTKILCKVLEKTSRILGGKGEVMYKALEDVYIRKPFEKLMEGLKWKARINALEQTIPKVNEALRSYYVPKAIRKWKINSWYDLLNKVMLIQRATKSWLDWLHKHRQERIRELLENAVWRKTDADELKALIPFKNWLKKAQIMKFNEDLIKIQSAVRTSQAKDKVNVLRAKRDLKNLFDREVFRQVKEAMNDAFVYKTFLQKLRELCETNDEANKMNKLRKYFNRWKDNGEKMNDAAIKIQCAFRSKQSRDKYKDLLRLKELLERLLGIRILSDQDRLRSGLKRWMKQSMAIACIDNSIIIERFLRPKLAKLINDRFKNFFYRNSQKLVERRLNQASKMNKLLKALKRPDWNEFIKCYNNKINQDKLRDALYALFGVMDDKKKGDLLRHYFDKWNEKAKRIGDAEEEAATMIENNYRNLRAKRKLKKKRDIRDRMLALILKNINDNDLKKQVSYNIWRNKTNLLGMNENARIIQDFADDIKDKEERRLRARKNIGYKKLAKTLANLKSPYEEPFNKIKSEANRDKFNRMMEILNDKLRGLKKDGYDAIKKEELRYLFDRLFKVPEAFKKRILQKYFDKYHDNAIKLGRLRSAEMIQKNWRLYLERKLSDDRARMIRDRLMKISAKWDDILRRYFNEWKNKSTQMKVLRAGRKINRFVNNKYNDYLTNKRWKDMANKLEDLSGINARKKLVERMRQYLALMKLTPPIEKNLKRSGMDALIDYYKDLKLKEFLRRMFGNAEERNNFLLLRGYFRKWNDNAQKLKRREEALSEALDTIDTREKIIAADAINNASLIKRLRNTFVKARKIDFVDRLNKNNQLKKKLEKLGKVLIKGSNEVDLGSKSELADKLTKLYTYKKLDKMYILLNNILNGKIKKEAGEYLLKYLEENRIKDSFFDANGEKESSTEPKPTILRFKKKVLNPKNIPLVEDKTAPTKKIMPFFVKYLEDKIKQRKKDAFNKLIMNDRDARFCVLLKKYNNRVQKPNKEELVNSLKDRSDFMDSRGQYILQMYSLLRKYWIRKVTTKLEGPSRQYRLMYLIKVTTMHKKIANQRFIREVSRKWRFAAFVKKMARKKLDLMYRNLQVSYLQMANEMFGEEDDVNPSVMKEFEMFGSNMGMFHSEDPNMEGGLTKKYVKNVQKKYVFKDMVQPVDQRLQQYYDEDREVIETEERHSRVYKRRAMEEEEDEEEDIK